MTNTDQCMSLRGSVYGLCEESAVCSVTQIDFLLHSLLTEFVDRSTRKASDVLLTKDVMGVHFESPTGQRGAAL